MDIKNLETLCKHMLDIENKKNIINNNEMLSNTGSILIYLDYNIIINIQSFIKLLNSTKKKYEIDKAITFVPYIDKVNRSTDHILIETIEPIQRKSLIVSYNNKILSNIDEFTWYVQFIKNSGCLSILEYDKTSNIQFIRDSINTIIIDNIKLFDVSDNLQQLDYPSITQYSIYNKIIYNIKIHYHPFYGINYEIFKPILPEITSQINEKEYILETIHLCNNEFKQLEQLYNIKTPSLTSNWYDNMNNTNVSDISKCFVSRIHLFGSFYKVTITNTEENNTYDILVSRYIIDCYYMVNNEKITFNTLLNKLTTFTIKKMVLIYSTLTCNLDIISNSSSDIIKNEIINSIIVNKGVYEYRHIDFYGSELFITESIYNDKTYIGFNSLSDINIIKLKLTKEYNNCIIYNRIKY